ncbi:MAG: hypothetical protein M3256_26745, partial [Actinomycetota bacterium]|nr:hypothetical protein [Actinomycetota bacterium]
MEEPRPAWRRPTVAAGLGWAVVMVALICASLLDLRLRAVGRGDLMEFLSPGGAVFTVAILSAATVGAALMTRRPRHPVGWLFLGLAMAVTVLGSTDEYAAYGAVARPGALPAARLVGMLGQAAHAPWLVLVTLVMLLTPTGRPPSPRWRPLQWVSVISGGLLFVLIMISSRNLQAPMEGLKSPLAWAPGAPVIAVLRRVAGIFTTVAAVVAASSLVFRLRSATEEERLQLRW